MLMSTNDLVRIFGALGAAALFSFLLTPPVRRLAYKIGAVDVPKDARRVHKKPVPRLGGLAIFFGFFIASLLLFPPSPPVQGMLLGAIVIVALGIADDVLALNAWVKLAVQVGAACIPVFYGVRVSTVSLVEGQYLQFGALAAPLTVIWIVALTNAVNFIDGLDGLAAGVSAISSFSLFLVAFLGGKVEIALYAGALFGACVGFLPFNLNPAKIFMGDTGATFLGFVLAVLSVQGLFKFYSVVSFAVPFLAIGFPIIELVMSVCRRVAHKKSPFAADRGHIHHRLIDAGLSQKQAVAILYSVSAVFGIAAVFLAEGGIVRALIVLAAAVVIGFVSMRIFGWNHHKNASCQEKEEPPTEADVPPEKAEEDEKAGGE